MPIFAVIGTLMLFILLFIPIPVALGWTAFLSLWFSGGTALSLSLLGKGSFEYLNNFSYNAVLFYIVMGAIMTGGESSRRLINLAYSIAGFFTGGLAMSAVMACFLFGAISGSSIATLVAIGSILVPAMVDRGYQKDFAIGLLTSSAELGILVPPSVPMIILAVTAGISVGRIYLAGYLPAVLFAISFSLYLYYYARFKGIPREKAPTTREIWTKFKESFWAIVLILIIAVGIYGGIFTSNEAAAIGTVYAILLELFIYRSMSLRQMGRTIINSAVTVGPLMFIVVGASFFGEYLTVEKIPQKVMDLVIGNITSPVVFLLMMNVFLLIVGCLIDMLSSIIIVTPVLMPIAAQFGIDPIHFGIIYVFNMGIGYITPPVGLDLYVSVAIFKVPLSRVVKACLPFFLILIVDLLIITYVPSFSLFLPNLFMGIVK
jgi:C4-dicarboxylate transporter DctM subunit